MSTPGEHKTVQPPSPSGLRRSGARILEYAQEIGWTYVSREEAERRRGMERMKDDGGRVKNGSLFFDDLLDAEVREFPVRRGLNRRERKEDLDFLSSLCSLRFVISATTGCSIRTPFELS
jgi:hypothetical protein